MFERIKTIFKYIVQIGISPLVLFGLYRLGLKTGYFERKSPPRITEKMPQPSRLFPLPDRSQLSAIVDLEAKESLTKEADEVTGGFVRIFGQPVPLDFKIKNEHQHWTACEKDVKKILADHSIQDIKFLWEPARFGFAFILGRAYHLTQNEKYAESFWKHFESFVEFNPPNIGPHWMNGQEVAIRMMTWIWSWHVFQSSPSSTPGRNDSLLQNIYAHAQRIPLTLNYARSQNNNHLITEAAAIYVAGIFFGDKQWRALGWQWLNWAFQHQIGGYGEYIQHSVNYQRLMLQTALFVNAVKKDAWPHSTSQALRRASHWLFSLLDSASGSTPNLGANDGALIFPLSVSSFTDYRPTVQACARAFLNSQIVPGNWDEMSLWFGVLPVQKTYSPNDYVTDNLHGDESWAYLRASTFRSRLSHIDQLHLDLWWRGLNIAQDAGTGFYNLEKPWDNPLITSLVHNTVTVNGQDQMTRSGRFLVLDWANAYSKPVIELDDSILYRREAYFTGYRRFRVNHKRVVTIYKNDFWEIDDKLVNKSGRANTYRLHWLLCDCEWKIQHNEFSTSVDLQTEMGPVSLTIQHPGQAEVKISLVRGGILLAGARDVQPYEGWVSRNYGQKTPALSFALEIRSPSNITLTSQFKLK